MTRAAPAPEQDAARDRPDTSSSDDELYEFVVRDLLRQGPVTVIRPGVLQVGIPTDDAPEPSRRTIEVRMTSAQVRERVTALSAGGQEALGIADPVGAGFALFTIHVESGHRSGALLAAELDPASLVVDDNPPALELEHVPARLRIHPGGQGRLTPDIGTVGVRGGQLLMDIAVAH